jgi:hypothetical protein
MSDAWNDRIKRRFDKMQRVLDGEDASSLSMSVVELDALLDREAVDPRMAERAFALLAHRADVNAGTCETAEQAAEQLREAIERPLNAELEATRKELDEANKALKAAQKAQSRSKAVGRADLLDFQARLVIEAAEAVAQEAEGRLDGADALTTALRQLVDRVILLHRAEDRLETR